MREQGEGGVPLTGMVDSSMEEGIMELPCDVAIPASGALAHYHRFTGRVRYIGANETVEDPVGAVGAPSLSWRLASGVVDENCWSLFPHRGLVREDVRQLPRWNVRRAASVANQMAEIRAQVMVRFLRESTRSFQVPKEFECNRAFLVDPAESIYVEKMNAYLFRGEGRHPMMTDDRVRNIVVREVDPRQWQTAFAWLFGTQRLVSLQGYTYFCEPGVHETDVRLSGRFEDRTRLMIPFDELSEVPIGVARIITPRGSAVNSPRVAQYFGAAVDARGGTLKRRYATSYVLEWTHAVAASLTLEHVMYNRVWVCDGRCVKFLCNFISFEDFVVDVVGHEVAQLSFRRLVSLLERARCLSCRSPVCAIGVLEGYSTWRFRFCCAGIAIEYARRSVWSFSVGHFYPGFGVMGLSSCEMALSGDDVRGSGWLAMSWTCWQGTSIVIIR